MFRHHLLEPAHQGGHKGANVALKKLKENAGIPAKAQNGYTLKMNGNRLTANSRTLALLFETRDLPGDVHLVITFFMHSNFSAKLQLAISFTRHSNFKLRLQATYGSNYI